MTTNTETIIQQDFGIDKKDKRKKIVQGIIIALILLLLSIVVLHRLGFIRFPWEEERMVIGNVQRGHLPGLSDEELLAELQRQADENNVTVQLNSRPVFENGESEGSLFLGNPEANPWDKHIEISLEETGKLLYDSGIIPPGYFIKNDSLLKVLEEGIHPAVANITFFDGNEAITRTIFNIEVKINNTI